MKLKVVSHSTLDRRQVLFQYDIETRIGRWLVSNATEKRDDYA